MNMNDLRLRNKSTHARGLVILLRRGKSTRKMHTTKFTCKNGDLRLPYKYCSVLCSHSEALVIDPEQLRWLEVS